MGEDGPDHGRIFDHADDPHRALAVRADQRINLVDLLDQARPVFPQGSFIRRDIQDAGRAASVPASFLFPREALL